MGRYQDFVLTLLREVMTPGFWYSIEQISTHLLDLRTKTSKRYMQLPSKHSLAQQMCRFFKNDIVVRKESNKNIYALLVNDEIDLAEMAKINAELDMPIDTQPHEWYTLKNESAIAKWVEYLTPTDDDEDFEIWM